MTQLPLPTDPDTAARATVGTYPTYAAAQRAVDHLSDSGFPVRHATIVGTDLRLVETVLGRMTTPRAAAAGAASGAWLGVLIGLLLSVFTREAWWLVLPVTTAAGALWGAAAAGVAHAATRGVRDFTSTRRLAAASYDVTVTAAHSDDARRLLMQLAWRGY
ncbi:general stress protein [Micromonospora endolithica]|uniref:General stress protein 17M-like domain-containing protein n=1 Tax=Micromonospora endolithica TaxID=230091 RepID=A0A3A9ZUQ0_9ACTN|nr:general stress protein [Micromonospora endolithica]RKN51117.1 hypothetical protein D7223_05245 [Micromonospora endolithica]TWJ22315.1 hypothetical protein JD76_02430 [Micromonospora endolithica]